MALKEWTGKGQPGKVFRVPGGNRPKEILSVGWPWPSTIRNAPLGMARLVMAPAVPGYPLIAPSFS